MILFCMIAGLLHAQGDSLRKTRFVIGLSAPELLHLGLAWSPTKSNLISITAGLGPTLGGVWPTLNAEHRLYFGKVNAATNRKKWFFRQSFTYFTEDSDQKAVALTVGADLRSRSSSSGWTIDLGGFVLLQQHEYRENKTYPALRFQYYSIGKKKTAKTS